MNDYWYMSTPSCGEYISELNQALGTPPGLPQPSDVHQLHRAHWNHQGSLNINTILPGMGILSIQIRWLWGYGYWDGPQVVWLSIYFDCLIWGCVNSSTLAMGLLQPCFKSRLFEIIILIKPETQILNIPIVFSECSGYFSNINFLYDFKCFYNVV